METSGPKDRWKSETDQDEKGETGSASVIGTEFHHGKDKSGTNADGSRCWSGEARKSSMEK